MNKFFRFADSYGMFPDGYGMIVAPLSDCLEEDSADRRRELASRLNDGLEVTLSWHPVLDELTVRVCDQRDGACFEINPEPHLALEVYRHPYAYFALSDARLDDDRLPA